MRDTKVARGNDSCSQFFQDFGAEGALLTGKFFSCVQFFSHRSMRGLLAVAAHFTIVCFVKVFNTTGG